MSVTYSYSTLTTEIIKQAHDDGTAFAAEVDNLIATGETKLLRDLDLEIFDSTDTGSFAYGSQNVTKPTGYLACRTLSYVSSGTTRVFMTPKTYDFLIDYWPTSGTVGLPKYYAELNTTTWVVAPTPNSAYTWTARFMKRPTGLSGSNTTSWLGTNAGDLLLLACMIASEAYLEADERIATWKAEYQEKLGMAKYELRRMTRSDYAPGVAAPTPRQEK